MSHPVDQAKNAETFLADTVHEQRLDNLQPSPTRRPKALAFSC
jgi:hypothetical protein